MLIEILDQRTDINNHLTKQVDSNNLSDKWDNVKDFIKNFSDVKILIKLESKMNGSLFINSTDGKMPMKKYDLFVFNDLVKVIKG